MRTLACLLLAGLTVAAPLPAQTHQDEVTVSLVEVPVYVSRLGKAVKNLSRDDFELFVNGRRQSIDYFDVLNNDIDSDEPMRQEIHRRRLIVLLFDFVHSLPFRIDQARLKAAKFVAEAPPGDVFAVAALTGKGIEFAVPFESNRSHVLRAIESVKYGPGRSAMVDDSLIVDDLATGGFAWERRTMLEHLGQLADQLEPLSGVKHVVLISQWDSPGLDIFPSHGVATHDDLVAFHERYRAASVILNAVDIAALEDSDDRGLTVLNMLAGNASGDVFGDFNELRKAESVTYVLGFQPSASRRGRNSIRVKVRNQPVLTELRYRLTYVAARAPEESGR